jgi:hypothetical protein
MQRPNRSGHIISSIIVKELKVCRSSRTMALSKRESRFIKDDVPGDDDSIGGEVKAAVPFVMSRIA